MGSNSAIKRRLTPHTLPGLLLTVWLLVSLSTSQSEAVTVPETDADPQREGQVLPALGISETFGRWTDVIRLGYNPTGAIPEFANTQQFLTILSDAAKIWERVSGVRFEILPAGNYPADHNNAQSSRDGIVNVFWASSAGSFAAQAGPRAGSYNEAEGYFPYTDGFVWLNSSCTSASCVAGMTSVLVHELGHLLGLGHSDTPDSIMFANPYTFLRNPRKDDIRAVQTLYGDPTTAFDAGKPLDEWLFVKPPLASSTKTQFLFKDNQNSRVNSDAMLVFSSQQQFDQALPPITASTPDDVWIRIFAPLGNFNNQSDIEIAAQVVVVDPSGYEYRRDNWQLSCRARNACFATFNFLQTSVAKFIPGRWQVFVVENAEQVASPELLLSLSFDVLTTPAFNNPPMANVEMVAGETPGTVRMRVLASDLERHRLSAVWHLPGQRIDRDGDRFLDNEFTEVLGAANVGNWQTINFGASGAKRLFVQVNDDGPRYGGQSGGLSDAGGGFQTLLRIDLQLNNNVPGSATLASSAVHQYRPTADWPYPFPGVTPAAAINSPFNTIGELTEANMTIQSCVRILNAGQPATVDGLSHIDLGFVITDMPQGIIQIVKSRGFNQSDTPTAQGEKPVCSGEFEASTGMYKDIIQVGAQTFATLFQLIDEPNLRLMLRDAQLLVP